MFGVLGLLLGSSDVLADVIDYKSCRLAFIVPDGPAPQQLFFFTVNEHGRPDFVERHAVAGVLTDLRAGEQGLLFKVPYPHVFKYVWVFPEGAYGTNAEQWSTIDQLQLLPSLPWMQIGVEGSLYTLDATNGECGP